MKEIIKIKEKQGTFTVDRIIAIVMHIGMCLAGLAASRGRVLSGLLPFGLSFAAGAGITYMPSVTIGAFLGYFFPAIGSGGFRYIAALLAIFAVRIMLSSFKKITENPMFCALISTLACGITGALNLNGTFPSIIKFFAECILCGAGAYFICRTSLALSRDTYALSTDEMACLLITASMLLTGLSEISVYGVDLMHITGVLLVLCAAKYGGTFSGAISGIAVSVAVALVSGNDMSYIAFAFGGVAAGIFAPYGRFAQISSLFLSGIVAVAVSGFDYTKTSLLVETVFGITFFVAIPKTAGIAIGRFFSVAPKSAVSKGVSRSLNMRVSMASAALADVSETIEQVSKQLAKINTPDFSSVITEVEQTACSGCKLRIHCWETRRDKTVEAIIAMSGFKTEDDPNKIPEEFRIRCIKSRSMQETVAQKYGEYYSKIESQNRIEEIRGIVEDQFEGISDMLYDLSKDFEKDEQYDDSTAQNISSAVKGLRLFAKECSCRIDRFGRMTVELKVTKSPEVVINKLQLMKTVSLAAERDFGIPAINSTGTEVYITLSEHANYSVDVGVSQISANGNVMCGDAYSCFNDGKGHYVAILSDGMGTGGRAAVDSAMASGLMTRLLKAGFGFDCSLRMLNSSMLFKSSDESLATVDIASVDLFTGEVEFYKAGAAPTVVRRSGKTGRAESTSLPIGILRDIGFDKAEVTLKDKDVIVLLSDGATNDGIEWIREMLEEFSDGKSQDLAEQIANGARRRRNDGHEDDITAISLILKRNI